MLSLHFRGHALGGGIDTFHLNEKDFDLLLESIKKGGAILRKEKEPTRKFEFCAPDLKAIRKNAKTTQIEFARMKGINTPGKS